jgi:hypothetical protein
MRSVERDAQDREIERPARDSVSGFVMGSLFEARRLYDQGRLPDSSQNRTPKAPYVIDRVRKSGVRYTAMYTDENGRYKSAGTYDTDERAQAVAEQHERHVRLRLAETSPADKATITVRDFGVIFLREHAVEPNSKMTYAQLLNSHIYPYVGKRRVAEIGRETIHRLLTVVLSEEGARASTWSG